VYMAVRRHAQHRQCWTFFVASEERLILKWVGSSTDTMRTSTRKDQVLPWNRKCLHSPKPCINPECYTVLVVRAWRLIQKTCGSSIDLWLSFQTKRLHDNSNRNDEHNPDIPIMTERNSWYSAASCSSRRSCDSTISVEITIYQLLAQPTDNPV
jgi:hypothetical protein